MQNLTHLSINSIDALLESDDFNEQSTEVLRQDLTDTIADLLDRKGSSKKSRTESLTKYDYCLAHHYMAESLYGRVPELIATLIRSVKEEKTEKETTLALHALSLTCITYEDDTIYENISSLLKRTISDSQSPHVKAVAIDSLAIGLAFGGADEEELRETLTFLLEIVSSDGEFIDAADNGEVVTAALQNWGFLATQIPDIEAESEDATATFLEQLDSNDVKVQIAAGENIALLYDKSYIHRDDIDSDDEDLMSAAAEEVEKATKNDSDSDEDTGYVRRYKAYHNDHEVIEKVTSLASLSTRSLNKKDRKALHQAFASIAYTIEDPSRNMRVNNKSKMKLSIHNQSSMRVDEWWKLIRLNALRKVLGGGFVAHYFEGNKRVLGMLPVLMVEGSGGELVPLSPRKAASGNKVTKGRFRNHPKRMVSDYHPDDM